MKFKELAYKSVGPIFAIGGGVHMVYGVIQGNPERSAIGFGMFCSGLIISGRTKYVTEQFRNLNERISQLEQKTK